MILIVNAAFRPCARVKHSLGSLISESYLSWHLLSGLKFCFNMICFSTFIYSLWTSRKTFGSKSANQILHYDRFFLLTWQSCFVFVACSAPFFFWRMKGRACELPKKSDHLVCKKQYTLLINDYSPFISRMRTSDGTWSSGSTPNFVQKTKKIKKHNL